MIADEWLRATRIDRRRALVGLAGMAAIVAAFAILRSAPDVWAVDAHRNLAAADALLHGTFGSVEGYLYSPLAAALTVPALAVPTDVAVVVYLGVRVLLLAAGALIATRSLPRQERLLVIVAVLAFLPLTYDLALGNVTTFVLAAIAMTTWWGDRAAAGIPLGIILATAPKPQLIPLLVWMAVARPRSLVGASATAAAATVLAAAALGVSTYRTWVTALEAPPYLSSGPVINLAVWAWPMPVAIAAALVTLGAWFVAFRNGYWPSLLAATCAGILLAPYTLIYAAAVLPAVAPAMARAAPRATLALALCAPLALILAFQAWVAAAMALAVLVPRDRWPPAPRVASRRVVPRLPGP